MKKNAKSIFKYLLEFIIVAFGVFLGIYVSEWKNEKNNEADKEKSMVYILDELERNKNKLQEALNYHKVIKSELDSIEENLSLEDEYTSYFKSEKFQFTKIKNWRGLYFAKLDQTAFDGVKISGVIKEYSFKNIQEITKIYNLQDTYTQYGTSLMNRMLDIGSATKVMDVHIPIQLMTTDLVDYEEVLIQEITSFQSKLRPSDSDVDQ